MKKQVIDLNSDVGESYGPYQIGNDEALFSVISSANIACGFHAGDPLTIRKTLDLAAKHNVAVGAHPGYPDRLHFGRVPLPYPPEEIVNFVLYQVGALQLMAETAGLELRHVKLHGALYHTAAQDRRLVDCLLDAIVSLHRSLIIVGPPNSVMQKEAEDRGLDYAPEGFADRVYSDDGNLLSRSQKGSLIVNAKAAARQALQIAREGTTTTASGKLIHLKVSTLCIHGDTPGAPEIAEAVRKALESAEIEIEPLYKILS
jgi:5-oxoprolinase (ATP-hydrolysing) subunit A